ncbi:TPA: GntR family transcriptional regulator [Streptococcus equi subsp. zooepidemicus]|nr:GntR family transcriptional regulator [Streptococcus equi subsp. zooepidemicus]HEL0496674.1 GntR family transcriptional regulator [Streptococcus equi subsp. zooepidemicus]HEL0631210.1 GntR family transcriptional regulator [Streptococcus equi subsp. zooepidemicus]
MNIIINTDSSEPIYEQIENQIKKQIMDEKLKTGDSIPSMRALARNLKVAVITVQKAYENLQKAGFIETIHGKGSFISARNIELQKIERYKEVEDLAKKIIKSIQSSSISIDDLIDLIKKIYEEGR